MRRLPVGMTVGLVLMAGLQSCVSSSHRSQAAIGDRGGQVIEIRRMGASRSGYRAESRMQFVAQTADGPLSFDPSNGPTYVSFYRPGPLQVTVTADSGHQWVTNELDVAPGDVIILFVNPTEADGCIVHLEDWTGRCP